MKENFAKVFSYANKFIQSDWYILFTAAMVFIGWCCNAWVPLLCILVAIGIIPLFFTKETKHLLPLIMMFTFIISTNRHALDSFAPLLVLVALLFVGMIFNLVRFRRGRSNWEFMHPTKIKGFHCSLIALIIPFAFGGVGSKYEHPLAVVAALALIIVMVFAYTFFMATNRDSESKEKLPQYMLKILLVAGILITLQLIVYYARLGGIEQIKQAILNKEIALGWAGKNNVAPTLAMCIPAGFYFCIKKSKLSPLFLIVSLIEFVFVLLSGCRGAILFTTLALPVLILYTAIKSENKVAFSVTICVAFALAIFLVAYFGEFFAGVINNIIGRGLDSAGRVESLYPEAWEAFKSSPFFGVGWDYRLGEFASSNYTPYWFHSTALQVLAMMGIVGVIAFVFFYFWRYRTLLAHRKNPAFVALLLALGLFDAYGMIDTNFFGPTFFAMLLCISFVADINLPDDKCRAFGGRNPFVDIKNGCLFVVNSIKNKGKKQVETANISSDIAQNENTVNTLENTQNESANNFAEGASRVNNDSQTETQNEDVVDEISSENAEENED